MVTVVSPHLAAVGYPGYAVVPIPAGREALLAVETLLAVLGSFTGEQPVHSGMWEGWGWWYDTGADPRTAPGVAIGVAWSDDDPPPRQEDIDLPHGATTCGPARRRRLWRSATSRRARRATPDYVLAGDD